MILSPLYPQEGNWPWAELGFGVRDGTHAADLERMEGLPSSAPQLGLTMRLYGGAPRTPCLQTTFSFAQQCPGSSYVGLDFALCALRGQGRHHPGSSELTPQLKTIVHRPEKSI